MNVKSQIEISDMLNLIIPELIDKHGAEDVVMTLLILSGYWANKTNMHDIWGKTAVVQARMVKERQ